MTRPTRKVQRWIALIAAYALAIQTLVTAFALGAQAVPLVADPLAAALCASGHAGEAGDSGQPADTSHANDCCTFGCGLFGPALTPAFAALIEVLPIVQARRDAQAESMTVARLRSPHQSRAPPQQA